MRITPDDSIHSHDAAVRKELERAARRLRRWQAAAAVLFLITAILTAGSVAAWYKTPRKQRVDNGAFYGMIQTRASIGGWDYNFMDARRHAQHTLPPGWTATLFDRRRQSVSYNSGHLVVSSRTRHPIVISLPTVSVSGMGGMKWEIKGRAGADWQGQMPALILDYVGEDGALVEGAKRITMRFADGHLFRTQTSRIPAGTTSIHPHFHTDSTGTLTIDTITTVWTPNTEKQLKLEGPLDLNRATAQQLESLPGLGAALAARIIEYRKEEGDFESIEQLLEIHGIGEGVLARIENFVTAR